MVGLQTDDLRGVTTDVRKAEFLTVTFLALLIAGCATDPGEVTGSITPIAPKPLLPAPPPPVFPDKPRTLAEPECKALISQISACAGRFKDKEKKAAYSRRAVEVAETLGSMEAGQRKATCKADLPLWRKDCGAP